MANKRQQPAHAADRADRLAWPSDATIFDVEALHRELCARLQAGGPLTVEAGAVTMLDTAAAQLLLAARKAWAGRGLAFSVDGASAGVRESLASVDCASVLES